MDFLKTVFSRQFIFNSSAVSFSLLDNLLFGFSIGLLVLSTIAYTTSRFAPHKLSKRMWARWSGLTLTIGLLLLLWNGFRYENVVFFGSRFFAIIILLSGLAWTTYLIYFQLTKYRVQLQDYFKTQEKNKYLKMK